MVNGTTTGGAGGPTVTVTNGTDFNTQINMAGARIVQVSGPISIGRINCAANKTIVGLGTNAALLGNINISGVSNVIVQNLRISNPGGDGLTIRENGALPGSHHVWIDHVTFYDCGDGSCDISVGADYVTVSWCKFIYPTQLEHRFTMIADGPKDLGPLTAHITLHHNWWSSRADQRMAATSDALVHYYNNYFNCTNNSYCSNAREEAELNIESNYYSGVNDPVGVSSGTTGKIKTTGNIYAGCTGTIHPGTDAVFTPPYAYTLDATAGVPNVVTNGAGAPGADVVVFPPKIWDGGGTDNNLNTANNWGYSGGYNETPKEYDVIRFSGSTRLTPNNNFTANNEYAALNFSNNAGAFVLGGNALNLGQGITNDSSAVQTINLNLDFTYAADHFSTNRFFNVSATNGSLVINGRIAGVTSSYGRNYSVTKLGAGLLTLAGINTFPGNFNFNGGLVRFGSLNTNVAGSLGACTNLNFNGGGLQWATGNTSDISVSIVIAIATDGAMFDVGANNVTISNRIGNNGVGGLTKLGTGRLTFNATNNYKGNTLIAAGTLALSSTGLLTNSPQIILSNNAVLDVSARADGTQTLLNDKSLLGNGTVRGSVIAASGSTVAPGFSIGTLIITNALTFQPGSTNVMEINATTHTNDLITGMTSVSYGGRLIVTNLSGTFAAGNTFKLFNAGTYGGAFTSITLPALTGNLVWTNRLAVDGTLAVVLPVNPAPTNLVFSVVGNQLQLSWPADRIGWRIESQTNAPGVGLGTNWVTLAGSTTTNQITVPVSILHGAVFYRMVYP
ncbi:MAG: autotransporter-associated beta strand repeat-containing protein [Verrucomicrobiota bacterium]